jgi:hypothetical protein
MASLTVIGRPLVSLEDMVATRASLPASARASA